MGGALIKKARATPPPSSQIIISNANDDRNKGLIRTVQRTSNLDAPIVSLAGAHAVSLSDFICGILNPEKSREKS
jgi:Prp8 binding protein